MMVGMLARSGAHLPAWLAHWDLIWSWRNPIIAGVADGEGGLGEGGVGEGLGRGRGGRGTAGPPRRPGPSWRGLGPARTSMGGRRLRCRVGRLGWAGSGTAGGRRR